MLMTMKETAEYLGLSQNAFRIRRSRDPKSVPPPSYRLGPTQYRWTEESIKKWLEDNCVFQDEDERL